MYLKSHVIYKLTCPACNAEYIGKTDRCLRVRLDEHSSDHNSAMFQNLHSCEAFKFLFSLNNLPGCFNNKANVACFNSHVRQTILNDCFLLGLYEILIPCMVLRGMEVIIEFAIK